MSDNELIENLRKIETKLIAASVQPNPKLKEAKDLLTSLIKKIEDVNNSSVPKPPAQ